MLKEVTVLVLAGDRHDVAGVYHPGERARSAVLPGFDVDVTDLFNAD